LRPEQPPDDPDSQIQRIYARWRNPVTSDRFVRSVVNPGAPRGGAADSGRVRMSRAGFTGDPRCDVPVYRAHIEARQRQDNHANVGEPACRGAVALAKRRPGGRVQRRDTGLRAQRRPELVPAPDVCGWRAGSTPANSSHRLPAGGEIASFASNSVGGACAFNDDQRQRLPSRAGSLVVAGSASSPAWSHPTR